MGRSAAGPRGTVGGGGDGDARVAIAELASATLDELKARHPEAWHSVGSALVAALEQGHAAGAARLLARVRAEAAPWRARLGKSGRNPRVAQSALPVLVRERLTELAVAQAVAGAAAVRAGARAGGDTVGAVPTRLRFGRWSGTLVQALLFRRGLERKPVSLPWFRLLWPLVTEKRMLMPLVEPRGIYCFYSRPLVTGLGAAVRAAGAGEALEIAAGDGTLARFLTDAGTPVRATDDHSWAHSIAFTPDVERLDAEAALARYNPRVVICSWPPPGNSFERRVFRAPSVARYIVLTTRHRFAAGSWPAYDEAAPSFDRRVDETLSRQVLPPEIDPVVLIFDRKTSAPGGGPGARSG